MSYKKKKIAFYKVSQPLYERYKELDSPIVECAAKHVQVDEVSLLNLEFLQENGCSDQSFSFELPFSQKNVEEQLGKLFDKFSLKEL